MATNRTENASRRTPAMKTGASALSASNATAYVLLIIGAVVLVNLIGTRVFGRLDLTENKRLHAVAGVQGRSSRNLPDYLTVKAYISKELPPELTDRQPLRARPARRVPDVLEGQAPLRGDRSAAPTRRSRRRPAPCKVQQAADPGDALAEVRGRRLLPGPLLPVPGQGRGDPAGRRRSRGSSTRSRR